MAEVVRIMIADDHTLLRQIVREVIEREQDLEVVAEAGNGQEAVLRAGETQPDVVLLDLVMPVCDGFEAAERILVCSPHSRVVIFSASDREEHVLRALQQGAIGYLTKDAGADGLITAIRRAAQNELFMTHPLAARLLTHLRSLRLDTPERARTRHLPDTRETSTGAKKHRSKRNLPLSRREKEVLNLVRQGQRNREIARELCIAESTVHKHVQNIFEKLDARNRAEALFLAET